MPLADDPRRADSLVGEIGWHADVGDHHLGQVLGGSCEELVVVAGNRRPRRRRPRSRAGRERPRGRSGCRPRARRGSTAPVAWTNCSQRKECRNGAATTMCGGDPSPQAVVRAPSTTARTDAMIGGTEVRTCASNRRSRPSRGSHPRLSRGSPRCRSKWASPTTTIRPRITSTSLEALQAGGSVPLRQPADAPGSRSRTAASSATDRRVAGRSGRRRSRLGGRGMTFAAVAFPRQAPGTGGRRRLGTLHADLRRPHRVSRASQGESTAVRPDRGTARLDDSDADALRRRDVDARADRCQPIPAPLGVRPRPESEPEVGTGRLQAAGTSTPSGSTRRGATRIRRRWSPRWRRHWSANCRLRIMRGGVKAAHPDRQAGRDAREPGRPRERHVRAPRWRALGRSRRSGGGPVSDPALSSASEPCSRADGEPRRSAP